MRSPPVVALLVILAAYVLLGVSAIPFPKPDHHRRGCRAACKFVEPGASVPATEFGVSSTLSTDDLDPLPTATIVSDIPADPTQTASACLEDSCTVDGTEPTAVSGAESIYSSPLASASAAAPAFADNIGSTATSSTPRAMTLPVSTLFVLSAVTVGLFSAL